MVKIRGIDMLRKSLLVIVLAGLFVVAGSGCSAAETQSKELLVSGKLLDSVGLRMGWQVHLPMKTPEQVDRMFMFDKYVYAMSNANYIYCIDTETKAIRFGLQLAEPGLPIGDPSYYENQLWFMVGNHLVVLDPKAGVISTRKQFKRIGTSAASMVVRNRRHLYVSGSDKRLHAIIADGFWQDFMVAADNGSQVNSIVADDNNVVFTTESGNVTSILANEAKRIWQYDIIGKISAPLVRDGLWIYIAGKNAKLYRLNIRTGAMSARSESGEMVGWNDAFHAAAVLDKAPVIGTDVVYQSAGDKGVYAIDKETGEQIWNVSKGVDMVAEIGDRAYVYAEPGLLVAMDNVSGQSLYSANIGTVEKYVVNTTDDSIYLADKAGRVMCIKEQSK